MGQLKTFLTINHTIDYMGRGVMIFRRRIDITRGIGWVVLGPGIARVYLGPLNGTRCQPSAIFGHKYARAIPRPKTGETFNTTHPIPQVMSIPRLKIIKPSPI